jgi:predicted nucleotidyltransferase
VATVGSGARHGNEVFQWLGTPKALWSLRKSNPPLLEWLKSPLGYRADPVFVSEFSALALQFYPPRRCFAHHLHKTQGNWRYDLRAREQRRGHAGGR